MSKSRAYQKIKELLPICIMHIEKIRHFQRLMHDEKDRVVCEKLMTHYFKHTQELDELLTKSFLNPATIKTLLKRADDIISEEERKRGI